MTSARSSLAERVDAGDKVSVKDLAVQLGHVTVVRREEFLEASHWQNPTYASPNGEYAAAAALHGWDKYEYDEGEPLELTKSDYEAALKAAANPHPSGIPVAHPAADFSSHDVASDKARIAEWEKNQAAHKANAEAAQRAREERRAARKAER